MEVIVRITALLNADVVPTRVEATPWQLYLLDIKYII